MLEVVLIVSTRAMVLLLMSALWPLRAVAAAAVVVVVVGVVVAVVMVFPVQRSRSGSSGRIPAAVAKAIITSDGMYCRASVVTA